MFPSTARAPCAVDTWRSTWRTLRIHGLDLQWLERMFAVEWWHVTMSDLLPS